MNKKILTGALALTALLTGVSYVQAEEIPSVNKFQQMRMNADFSEMRDHFRIHNNLTDEQREELKELRKGGDMEAVHEKMQEFGITAPDRMQGRPFSELTNEQRKELRKLHESGDMQAIHELMENFDIDSPREKNIESLENVLSDSDFEKLQNAQEDIKKAHEEIKGIYEDNKDTLEEAGMKGFFHKIGGFLRGLFT